MTAFYLIYRLMDFSITAAEVINNTMLNAAE